jgi:hypothetical protein
MMGGSPGGFGWRRDKETREEARSLERVEAAAWIPCRDGGVARAGSRTGP